MQPTLTNEAMPTSPPVIAAPHGNAWHEQQETAPYEAEAQNAAAIVDLLDRLAACRDLELAGHTLVNQLQRFLKCHRVIFGLCRHGRSCQVQTISELSEFDRRSNLVRAYEAVLDESVLRGGRSVWPPSEETDRHALLAHKRLANSAPSESVVSQPIRDRQGNVRGAWIFLADEPFPQQTEKMCFIEAAAENMGEFLGLLQRAQRGRIERSFRWAARSLKKWYGRVALAAAAVVIALMFVPFPHRVKCDCELQPVLRRYVAAPFDATLDKSFVEPGDLVAEDQILAQIDGREIRWELAGVTAQRSQAEKQRDGHLATYDFGAAEVDKLEMQRLALKSKVLQHRGDNLDIRSPIDGIVTSGDLEKAEGVPLTTGQTLFEVAPLDRMVVEIEIPETDVRHMQAGLPVTVRLEAYPGRRWEGDLAAIHPRSEFREDTHVFISELPLDNPQDLLRPGMQGKVTIRAGRRPLGWILFHRPWQKLLFWMGW